jgi:hypothetical protein
MPARSRLARTGAECGEASRQYARSLAAGAARSLLRASPDPLACQCRTSAPILARLRRKPPETAKKPTRRAVPRETLSLLSRPFQTRERRYWRGWRLLWRPAFKSVARRVAQSTLSLIRCARRCFRCHAPAAHRAFVVDDQGRCVMVRSASIIFYKACILDSGPWTA